MRVSSELLDALDLPTSSPTATHTSTLREVTRAILRVQQNTREHEPSLSDQGIIKDDRLAPLLDSSPVHILWALDVLYDTGHLSILTSLDVDVTLEDEKAFWASTGLMDKLVKEAEQCTGWE